MVDRMRNALKTFFKNVKPGFLVIALILSFGLWFFSLNYSDPVTYENFLLRLQLLNEDVLTENRRLIENKRELENTTVNVHVTGLKSVIDNLVSNRTINAYIDLRSSELAFVSNTRLREQIPVRIGVDFQGAAQNADIRITSISPEMTMVIVDRIETKVFTLGVHKDGELPSGYVYSAEIAEPRTVTVVAAASVMSQIDRIGTNVDLTDVRTDIEGERPVVAYNSLGDVVTGFNKDVESFSFKLPVFKTSTAQIIMSDHTIKNGLNANIDISNINISPSSVELKGHVDEVEDIQNIVLDPAAVKDIAGTQAFTYDLNEYLARLNSELGSSVSLLNPSDNMVTVTYVTEPIITKQYTIPIDRVHFSGESQLGNRRRIMHTESIDVTLSGVESIIKKTTEDMIICRVDTASLANEADGEHVLVVNVTTPVGTEIVGEPPSVGLSIQTIEPEPSISP